MHCKITIFTHKSDALLSHECTTRAFNVHQAHTCQSHNPKSKKTSFEQWEKNVSSAYTLITLSFTIQWKHDFFSSPVSLILFLQGWIILAFLLHRWQQKGGCASLQRQNCTFEAFWGKKRRKKKKKRRTFAKLPAMPYLLSLLRISSQCPGSGEQSGHA